ncbi:hypothetical protein GCM10010472_34460 [Pseudonocardia halophobica]|uniref:Uncharacterized protein n=1 Tax=Pseudonocardia halophobica TaxID=29401 RepID=A0A9W6NW76_9PSEU|nr:hypothetical protein [Pseudonocardia halophobica]GLL12085.1 hypothetical protein GCM10017577_32260 [Pseudonocardia halophobica]
MHFRRAALALVAAAGLAGLAGCATSGPTPLCDQARGLVDEGQLAQAAELFARAQVRNEGACADDGLTEVGDRYTMAYTDAARGSAAEIEGRTDLARSAYESALRLDAGNQAASNGLVRLGLPPAERSAPLPLPAVAPYPQASWWTGWQLALPALVLAVLAVVGVALLWRRGGIGPRSASSDRPESGDGGGRPAAFREWRGRGWRRSRAREDDDLEPLRPGPEDERGVRSTDLGVPPGDGREWSRGVGVGTGRADRGSETAGETSGGETSGGETSGGETSGGETSGGETSGGETSGGGTGGGGFGNAGAAAAAAGGAAAAGAALGGAALGGGGAGSADAGAAGGPSARRADSDRTGPGGAAGSAGSRSAEAGAPGRAATGGRAPEGSAGRGDLDRADRPTGAEAPKARKERSWLTRGRDLGRGKAKRGRRTQQEADARWARMREEAEPEPTEVLPPDSRPLPAASSAATAAGVLAAGEVAAERQEADPTPREVEPSPRREAEPSPRSEARPSSRDDAGTPDRSEAEPTARGGTDSAEQRDAPAPGTAGPDRSGTEPSDRGGDGPSGGTGAGASVAGAEPAERQVGPASERGGARPGGSEAEPSDRIGDESPGRGGAESAERSNAEASGEPGGAPSSRGGDQASDRGEGEPVDDGEALASGAITTAAHLGEAQPSDRSEEQPGEKREAPSAATAEAAPPAAPESESTQQDQPGPEQREPQTAPAGVAPLASGDAGATASTDAASAEAQETASERHAAAQPSSAGAVSAGIGAVAAQASAGRDRPAADTQPSDTDEPSTAEAEPTAPTSPDQPTEAAETRAGGPTDSKQPAHADEPPATPTVTAAAAEPTDRPRRTVVEEIPEPTTPSDDELFEERAAAEAPTVPEAAAGTAVAAAAAQAAGPAQTGTPAAKAETPDPALRSQLATLDLELGQLQRLLNRSLRTDRDGGPPRFFAAREPVKGSAVAVTLEIVSLQLTGGDHIGNTVCVRRTVFAERPPGPWVPADPDNRWQDVAEEVDHRATGSIRDSDGRMWITPGREDLRGTLLDLDRVRPAWLPLLLGDGPSASLPLIPPPSDQVTGLKAALDGAQPVVSPQPRPSGVRLLAIVDALLAGPALTNVRVDAVANEVLALAAAESVEHELDRHLVPLGR